ALAVDGRRIVALGPSAEVLARYQGASRVNGRGRGVVPGLGNTHTHLPRRLAPLPLPRLTDDEERVMALLGTLEAIRSGTTLVLEEGVGIAGYAVGLFDSGL